MTGYIRNKFCDDEALNPHFRFERSHGPEPIAALWKSQCYQAKRIDPEPTDLTAVRQTIGDLAEHNLPDLIAASSLPIVCDAFRTILQELEPGRHQFVPIRILDETGVLLSEAHWLMNVLQCRTCVVPREQVEQWQAEGHRFPEADAFWSMHKGARRALTLYLDKVQVEGLHLWRPIYSSLPATQRLYPFEFFLSDELLARIEEAGLRKLSYRSTIEISVPQAVTKHHDE